MFKVNLTAQLVCIATSLALLLWVIPNFTPPYPGYGIPSTLFPNILAAIILICSCINCLRVIVKKAGQGQKSELSWAVARKFIIFLLPVIAAMPLMSLLGFIPGGVIVIISLQLLLGECSVLRLILVPAITVTLLYLAFWHGLRILLP